ncbi:DUF262 domain-containing protein [Hymenobacter psychrophilus]|uniref:GmrSD restriction endonucleases N-terminal domain-containing protein n=1 Tax=Hymenobacter psychrophilus TaxID=651662 RepID=A0A1H3NGD7_9BACT|nr:DUF262 domain-containing protein [Hymenobacter psychrophilus]SDY87259.1 Protein of unknown function DUF262 [Hymenobacter psychrophilus]
MPDLFTRHDVASVAITDYVAWFLDEDNPRYNLAQLPPIQRNSVWNIAQVERLWDSLLRGFPIGSMLLAHRVHGQAARSLTSSQQMQAETDGYFLLDGQQRTRTLLLGFQPTESSRLWIDLSPQLTFNDSEYNDRKFLLRLLTGHQPWGMRRQNPEDKLPENLKHEARQKLGDSRRYDYLINPIAQGNDAPDPSWPVEARTPVPLDALLQLCGGWRGPFTRPSWQQVQQLVPACKPVLESEPPHLAMLLGALENLLVEMPSSGRPQRSIPLLLHPEPAATPADSAPEAEQTPDSVEVLFRRVNAGGTVLAGEEMAYSLLKSSWDQAYELVSQVITHRKVGYLFPPTGVVMAAARLARRQQGYQDLNPSVPQFRRWLGQSTSSGTESSFLQAMKSLLVPATDQSEGRFTRILEEFCKLALYDPEAASTDPGLPRKLLLDLNPVLLHPALSWIDDNLTNPDLLQANRLPVLRYLFYLLIVHPDAQKYARLAGEVLAQQQPDTDFPDQAIYRHWVQKVRAPLLPAHAHLIHAMPHHASNGWLSNEDELFGPYESTEERPADPFHAFRSKFWHHRHLLLWFQRAHLDRWFVGYDPMRQDTADTPYDYDHIVPYSHVVSQGRTIYLEEEGNGRDRFNWYRRFYLDSLGNFRIWPAWANRSDGNTCHTQKLRLHTTEALNCDTSLELKLNSSTDYVSASAIPVSDTGLWQQAGGGPGHWPPARRAAWVQAVESRASHLYDELFTAVNFNTWYEAASLPVQEQE